MAETARSRAGRAVPRGRLRPEAARRTSARGPGLPEHLLRRHVEPRLPDHLPPLQRHRRRGVRAGVPAAQAGAAGAAGVRRAAADARIADAGPRVRRVRLLGLVRVGLHQRRDDAPAGGHGSASRGARSPRSARGDRRRRDVRQPGAAGAVRRRDRRRRRREPDSGSGGCAAADARPTGSAGRTGDPARLLHPRVLRRALRGQRHDRGVRAEARHRRAGDGEEGGGEVHRAARSAGDVDLHARHRVRLAVPDRGRARLREPVPLLLGRLQLPAGARLSRRSHPAARGRRPPALGAAPAWCRSRCATTRRSIGSCAA